MDENGQEIGRYDKSLDLMEDNPTLRFRRVLTESGLINQLMGVMRTEVAHSMLPLTNQPAADWLFLAELSLYGKIMELPKYQYFRRFHEEASSWDRDSDSHYVRLVTSEGTRGVVLRAWSHHCGLMRRVARSPLGFKAKLELLRFLGRRAVWDRAALIDECRQLLWPARATASSSKRR